jgi:transcriptional regulator with XRE-family HTH domain
VDAIRRIERGRISPSLDTLAKLSEGLRVSLPTLFEIFEKRQRDEIAELCDLLTSRSQREVQLVLALARVVLTHR